MRLPPSECWDLQLWDRACAIKDERLSHPHANSHRESYSGNFPPYRGMRIGSWVHFRSVFDRISRVHTHCRDMIHKFESLPEHATKSFLSFYRSLALNWLLASSHCKNMLHNFCHNMSKIAASVEWRRGQL